MVSKEETLSLIRAELIIYIKILTLLLVIYFFIIET